MWGHSLRQYNLQPLCRILQIHVVALRVKLAHHVENIDFAVCKREDKWSPMVAESKRELPTMLTSWDSFCTRVRTSCTGASRAQMGPTPVGMAEVHHGALGEILMDAAAFSATTAMVGAAPPGSARASALKRARKAAAEEARLDGRRAPTKVRSKANTAKTRQAR